MPPTQRNPGQAAAQMQVRAQLKRQDLRRLDRVVLQGEIHSIKEGLHTLIPPSAAPLAGVRMDKVHDVAQRFTWLTNTDAAMNLVGWPEQMPTQEVVD